MDLDFEQALAKASVTSEEKIRKRIGEERAREYSDIAALLALMEYRLDEEAETGNDTVYGLSRIFASDNLMGKKASTRALAAVICPVLWAATKIKYAFRPKGNPRMVFSNSFIFSRRYPLVKEQVEAKCGCTAVLCFYDTLKRITANSKEMLRDTVRLEAGRMRPVTLPCYSAADAGLQRAVTQYYELLHRSGEPGAVKDAEWDAALSAMRKTYQKRAAWLAKKLRKAGMRVYISVNQYNLRDLLIMNACREIGVPTMQMEHHAMEFSRLPFDPARPMPRLAFASHYGFWSDTERRFHEKVFRYENMLYPPEKLRFLVSGNAEISREQAEAFQAKFPAERKLTFMTSGIEDTFFSSKEDLEVYEKWRWSVFSGLRELAKRQNIQICLRYTPNREMYFREKEIPDFGNPAGNPDGGYVLQHGGDVLHLVGACYGAADGKGDLSGCGYGVSLCARG